MVSQMSFKKIFLIFYFIPSVILAALLYTAKTTPKEPLVIQIFRNLPQYSWTTFLVLLFLSFFLLLMEHEFSHKTWERLQVAILGPALLSLCTSFLTQ